MAVQVVAGLAGLLGGLLKLSEHPVMAYFLVLGVLFLDTGQASLLGNAGAAGIFLSGVMGLLGVSIVITSFQLLVFAAIFPLVMYALNKSAQVNA